MSESLSQELQRDFKKYLSYFTTYDVNELISMISLSDEPFFYKSETSKKIEYLTLNKKILTSYTHSVPLYLRLILDEFVLRYTQPRICDIKDIVHSAECNLKVHCRSLLNIDLSVISYISYETYESETIDRMVMVLIPCDTRDDLFSNDIIKDNVIFFSDRQLTEINISNSHSIRKQLNITKCEKTTQYNEMYCLVVACEVNGKAYSVGIGNSQLINYFPYVSFNKKNSWKFFLPKGDNDSVYNCLFKYERSRFNLEINPNQRKLYIMKKIKETLSSQVCDSSSLLYKDNVIEKVLHIASKANKGSTIVLSISSAIEQEADRLCKQYNRGFQFEGNYNNNKYNKILKQFSNIDGAFLIDFNGKIWASGVILDGQTMTEGDPSRGARYNIIPNYLQLFKRTYNSPIVVIVISEDGMINIFPEHKMDSYIV